MPWRDWQFWLVTLIAIWGVWILARPFMPRKRAPGAGSPPTCSNCSSGSASTTKPRRVALTVEKRRV